MNEKTEVWKDITGYEGLYQVSNETHRHQRQRQMGSV